MVELIDMFPLPSNDAEPTTSPAIAIVLAVKSAEAVSALPSKSAINLPFVCPVPLVLTVVVGSDCFPLNSIKLLYSDASKN